MVQRRTDAFHGEQVARFTVHNFQISPPGKAQDVRTHRQGVVGDDRTDAAFPGNGKRGFYVRIRMMGMLRITTQHCPGIRGGVHLSGRDFQWHGAHAVQPQGNCQKKKAEPKMAENVHDVPFVRFRHHVRFNGSECLV